MGVIYGRYKWVCQCGKVFLKDTPQGLGMAKENHLRSHRVKQPVEI